MRKICQKVLIGCSLATVLTILVILGLVWGGSKAYHYMLEEGRRQTQRQQIASDWQPPAKRLDSDKFFPVKVGTYQLETDDTQSDIPELFLLAKGRHAVYRSGSSQIHVYVYPMTKSQMNKVFEQIEFNFKLKEGSGGFVSRSIPEPGKFGTHAFGHIWTSRWKWQRNYLWYVKQWLHVFRTTDGQDHEPFTRAYLQATSATRSSARPEQGRKGTQK